MANSLAKNGYDVFLIDELDSNNGNLVSKEFTVYHVDTKYLSGIRRYWNFHCILQGLAAKISPDIYFVST